jgi:hypothetical protein
MHVSLSGHTEAKGRHDKGEAQQENILPLHLPPQQSVGKWLAEISRERGEVTYR